MPDAGRAPGASTPPPPAPSFERAPVHGGFARYVFPGLLLLLIAYGFLGLEELPSEWKVFFAVAAGLTCYLLTFADIRIGLALVIVASAVTPEFTLGGIEVRLEDFLIPIVFLAWLAQSAADRRPLRWTPVAAPALLLLGWLAFSTLNAVVIGEATRPVHSLFHFARIAGYFLLFVITFNAIRAERDLKAFIVILLSASVAVAVFGSYQAWLDPTARVAGPTGETPNIFGAYLLFHGMLLLGLFVALPEAGARLALVAAGAVLFVPFAYSQSRGSYAALGVALGVVGILRAPRLLLFVAVAAGILPLIAPEHLRQRAADIPGVFGGAVPLSWRDRTLGWRYQVQLVSDSPIVGVGVGTEMLGKVDNEYILKAREGGIPAVAAFAWLLARLLRLGFLRSGSDVDDRVLRGFALGYFGGLAGLCVTAVAATTFTTIRTMEPFWIATGLLASIEARAAAHAASASAAGQASVPSSELLILEGDTTPTGAPTRA